MRLPGWEQRLEAVLAEVSGWAYELGSRDCFRLTCLAVETLTGVDRWPEFAGYTTKREALKKLAQYGSSFEAAGDWFFGQPRVNWRLARRGDIAALQTSDGEKHLGVVKDHRMMLLSHAGAIWLPLPAALCAWRVG